MNFRRFFGLCVLLEIALTGCEATKPVRVPVSGQVRVNGQVAADGVVRFEPIKEKSGPARASAMVPIIDGKYQVQASSGLQEGRYRVEVEVWRKTGKKTKKQVLGEIAEVDETVLVSSQKHAGKDSPLEYMAQSTSNDRFDIDVPKR